MPVVCESLGVYFTHVPRAAGSVVERVLVEHLGGRCVGPQHASCRACPPEHPMTRRVLVVRDPVSWYRSYWAHARSVAPHPAAWPIWQGGDRHHPTHRIDVTGGAPTFEEFVRKMLRVLPNGFVRSMYCRYLNGMTHALRFERLGEDLASLLAEVGVDPTVAAELPRLNESAPDSYEVTRLDPELEAELRVSDNLDGLDVPFTGSPCAEKGEEPRSGRGAVHADRM